MPKEKQDKKIDLRVTSDLARRAKAKAKAERRSLSDVVRDLLQNWLSQ
jgi:predicted HicB family RNase H-like nuclease